MKILIIIAHPCDEGHNRTILKNVTNILKDKKIEYEIIDLYKNGFNPMMKSTEHFNSKKRKREKDVLEYQEKIKNTDKLIFISPIWWNSVPAGLKGFFDRVFSSGFAYKYVKILNFRGPKPLLKGKKAVVFLTSGSPKIAYWTIQGRRGAKVICKDTLRFCGIKSKVFHFGNAYKLTPDIEKKLAKLTSKGMKWII